MIRSGHILPAVVISFGLLAPTVAPADDVPETANLFACAIQALVECPAGGTCAPTTHEASNAPALIYVYMSEGVITGREPSGALRVSKINDSRPVGDMLILQGNDLDEEGHLGAAGWTMAIDRESGRLSMSVSADQVVFAAFGVCEAPPS